MKKPINILYELTVFAVCVLLLFKGMLVETDEGFALVNVMLFIALTSSITLRAYLSNQMERGRTSAFLLGSIFGLYVVFILGLSEGKGGIFTWILDDIPEAFGALILNVMAFGFIASVISLVEYLIIKAFGRAFSIVFSKSSN